jgi:hypothetical protein
LLVFCECMESNFTCLQHTLFPHNKSFNDTAFFSRENTEQQSLSNPQWLHISCFINHKIGYMMGLGLRVSHPLSREKRRLLLGVGVTQRQANFGFYIYIYVTC